MERLTIDEIIAHCGRNVKRNEKTMSREQFETGDMSSWFMKEYWEHRQVIEYLNELKAYKSAEEQGLLLRLPCKVGDTVYSVVEDGLQIFELEFSLDFFVRRKSDFGKTVFLTKEEAELELANRQQSHAEAIMDERNGR